MPFSPEQGFERIKKAIEGDQEVIAQAEIENLKNSALEAGAQLTAQAHEKDPKTSSGVVVSHTEKPKASEAPAKHWLADWEAKQEEQDDRRRELFNRDGNK